MGIAERREREKEQRKNDIIDAAERVFFRMGHEHATMDDVAEEAELSKGTLYLYFKNKEELYLAIHLRGNRILHELFKKAVQGAQNGLDQTQAIGRAYVDFYKNYPDYFNALLYYESRPIDFGDENSVAIQCLEEGRFTLELLIEAIETGKKDGSVKKDIDAVKTAVSLWGQTTGVVQIASFKEKIVLQPHFSLSAEDVIEYSFELLGRALKA
jgi:TetR/AcrR family transcriptional regulator